MKSTNQEAQLCNNVCKKRSALRKVHKHLLHNRSVFVLLNLGNNPFNIHSCIFLYSMAGHPPKSLVTKSSHILDLFTCTKCTRRASLNQNASDPWIRFPFIHKCFVLYIHICIIQNNHSINK